MSKFHNKKINSFSGSIGSCPVCIGKQFQNIRQQFEEEKLCLNCGVRTSNNLWNRTSEFKNTELGNVLFAVVKFEFEYEVDPIPSTVKLFYDISSALKFRKSIIRDHWIYLLEKKIFNDSFNYIKPKVEEYIGPLSDRDPGAVVDDLIFCIDNYLFYNEPTQRYYKLVGKFNMVQVHTIEDKGDEDSNLRSLIFKEHLGGIDALQNGRHRNGRSLVAINRDENAENLLKEINLSYFKKLVLDGSNSEKICTSAFISGDRDELLHKYFADPIDIFKVIKHHGIEMSEYLEGNNLEKIKGIIEETMGSKFVRFCDALELNIQ